MPGYSMTARPWRGADAPSVDIALRRSSNIRSTECLLGRMLHRVGDASIDDCLHL